MKKQLLVILLCLLFAPVIMSQELITGGDMESADTTAWHFYLGTNGYDTGFCKFNYTDDVPKYGSGGCYRVRGIGRTATFLWQPVTITPGHVYSFTGAFKNANTDTIKNTWVELILTRKMPSGGEVSPVAGDYRYSQNTWNGAEALNMDTTFQDGFPFEGLTYLNQKGTVYIPDTVTTTTWYVVVKNGCWIEPLSDVPMFDLLWDEVSLVDLGPAEWSQFDVANKIDAPNIADDEDFSVKIKVRWDVDSIYMVFDVSDDSITTTASNNIWDVDNIEIYLDMDNSKNIKWPRNAGWPTTSLDAKDYQLRIVPDSAWGKYNSAALNTRLVYNRLPGGYQFIVNIPWDTLDKDFTPEVGALLGFDILASDNDAVPNYRDQVSWNSPSTWIWNDASLWGVLELRSNGVVWAVADKEKPSNPANVVATVNGLDVTLTWDPSTDNRAVQNYIIHQGTQAVDTILAKQTGNSYTFTGLTPGSYTFGVTAMDIYGNKSGKVTTTADVVSGIEEYSDAGMLIFPNPSNGRFNIVSENSSTVVFNVYSITGSLITSGVFSQNYILDLTSCSKGVYYLQLKSEGKTSVKKLVIR